MGRLILFLCAATLGACSKKIESNLKAGSRPFQTPIEKVERVEIYKNHPGSGDRWTAVLKKTGDHWELQGQLEDKLADDAFLLHLLDTLSTVTLEEKILSGSTQAFGLNPPAWSIRWTIEGKTQGLELGEPALQGNGAYAKIDNSMWIIRGSMLGMLSYLKTFEVLRHRKFLTLTSDDVAEVSVKKRDAQVFYAQRQSGRWGNKRNKIISTPVSEWLQALVHVQIETFVDDSSRQEKLRAGVLKNPVYEVEFRNRHGQSTRAAVQMIDLGGEQKLFGVTSSRPDAVFELPFHAIRLFEPPPT